MKGRAISYSAAELAWIEANAQRPRREMRADFAATFGREDVSLVHLNSLCKRKGWMTGRTGCFAPGQVPPNKGRKGYCPPGCEKGWFKKGGLPHNTRYLGHERISREGYVEVSVAEPNPHTGYERRYVEKHRWLWEQANGPVPEGHCLKCLGDKLNTDPSNWECIPRAMLPRLNGRYGRDYDAAPAEVKPTLMAITKLEHAVRTARTRGQGIKK